MLPRPICRRTSYLPIFSGTDALMSKPLAEAR
jgi:hypothetical protein